MNHTSGQPFGDLILSPNWTKNFYFYTTGKSALETACESLSPTHHLEAGLLGATEPTERGPDLGIGDMDPLETEHTVLGNDKTQPVMLSDSSRTARVVLEPSGFLYNNTIEQDFLLKANETNLTSLETEPSDLLISEFFNRPELYGDGSLVVCPGHSLDNRVSTGCVDSRNNNNNNNSVEQSDSTRNKSSVSSAEEGLMKQMAEQSENGFDKLAAVGFACPLCNKFMKSLFEMQYHLFISHKKNSVINLSCTDINNFDTTLIEILRPCFMPKCTFKTPNSQLFYAHLEKEHKPGLLVCKECDFACLFKKNLRDHCKTEHNKQSLACKFCPYVALKRDQLTVHIKGMHYKRLLKCAQCSFSTVWSSSLSKHKIRRHSNFAVKK
jgi:hypothetical protein